MKTFLILIIMVIFILAVVFGPILVIWALNTLFAMNIEYTVATWFATAILCGIFGPASITFKKDS